ncbi:hypothetical protein [Ruminococcus sp.]|uniref:hypothetical protein n=1 Tax=Ruminococcus sp. TaxID=41978 RepID=UPI0025F5F25E|nr:hypothetical protein [Ruminococcus sp.]MBQ8966415.1 hypothetical protein [Ruminococcus sp.]
MNDWTEITVYMILTICIITIACVSLILLRSARRNGKSVLRYVGFLGADTGLFILMLYFFSTHPISYKFNNNYVYSHDIKTVIERYGDFDTGHISESGSGVIGYYIYTDDGPIMPDHMKHYYWIKFDANGTVTDIYDAVQKGG